MNNVFELTYIEYITIHEVLTLYIIVNLKDMPYY